MKLRDKAEEMIIFAFEEKSVWLSDELAKKMESARYQETTYSTPEAEVNRWKILVKGTINLDPPATMIDSKSRKVQGRAVSILNEED